MSPPLLLVTEILLDEVAELLTADQRIDYEFWLDTHRGVTLCCPDVDLDSDELCVDELPGWLSSEEVALVREIQADTTRRYRYIPALGSHGRLARFARSIENDELADAVWSAMRGGRGGYRRVKDLLHRRNQEELWYRFEREQDRADARKWLQEEGLLPFDEE